MKVKFLKDYDFNPRVRVAKNAVFTAEKEDNCLLLNYKWNYVRCSQEVIDTLLEDGVIEFLTFDEILLDNQIKIMKLLKPLIDDRNERRWLEEAYIKYAEKLMEEKDESQIFKRCES